MGETKDRQLAAVQQIARTLAEELNPERVAELIADQSFQVCDAATTGVWLVDAARERLQLVARRGAKELSPEARRALSEMPMNAASTPAVAARTGQPVEIRDIAAVGPGFELSGQLMREEGLRSVLAQPLFARGRVVGVLTVLHSTPHTCVPEEREVVQAVGDLWSVAIDNARLYQEAQTAEAYYRALLQSVPDAVLIADAEGHYVDVNQAALDLLGYTREEFLDLTVADLAVLNQSLTNDLYEQFLAKPWWKSELDVRRKDGSTVPVESRARRIELPTGT